MSANLTLTVPTEFASPLNNIPQQIRSGAERSALGSPSV
jgi:hypothetical protein